MLVSPTRLWLLLADRCGVAVWLSNVLPVLRRPVAAWRSASVGHYWKAVTSHALVHCFKRQGGWRSCRAIPHCLLGCAAAGTDDRPPTSLLHEAGTGGRSCRNLQRRPDRGTRGHHCRGDSATPTPSTPNGGNEKERRKGKRRGTAFRSTHYTELISWVCVVRVPRTPCGVGA